MKLDLITNKDFSNNERNENDEFYTPNYAIEPIIEYIKKNSIVWCPFDLECSNYVKILKQKGFNVICSHLENGQDFFNYEPNMNYDYIISNPPYSLKYEVFERLFKLEKPFAMLVGVVGLFESKKRFNLFKNNNFEIMYFDKRISYFKDYKDQVCKLNPPFSSVYITCKILPNKIMFKNVRKLKNTNQSKLEL
tara:strand:+ start:41 stop:619 length:579 start_codon:yes stop_codon:yes gene_type:complete